jgi:1-acyl-sn-glycerol-3-phosphate acyltransferase
MKVLVPCWCKCAYQFEVRGTRNIPKHGPVIIAPKHQYWTDIPLIGYAFYNIQLNYIAKQELFRFPLIRHLLIGLGGIPLDRSSPIKSLHSFKHLYSILKQEQHIVIFPEGTYYRERVGRGKSRLIKMILKFQETENLPDPIPFIPVGVIYGKKGFRKSVTITRGKPLYAARETEAQELTQEIMSAIASLSNMDLASKKNTHNCSH